MEIDRVELRVAVDATFAGVRKLAGILCEAFDRMVSRTELYELELAFVEACNNAVKYGTPEGKEARIQVEVHFENRRLEATVSNHGKPFDFDAIQFPKFDTSRPETLPTGGMGVALIREIMDTVSYHAEDGLNQLRLTKELAGPGTSSARATPPTRGRAPEDGACPTPRSRNHVG